MSNQKLDIVTPSDSGVRDSLATGLMLLSLFSFGSGFREEAIAGEPGASPPILRQLEESETKVQKLARITLSEAGKQWMEREMEIIENTRAGKDTPRLIDGTTFLTPEMKALLGRYTGQSNGTFTFKAIDHDGYSFVFEKKNGEQWFVSECPYYKDQFPGGIPFTENAFEVWKAGSAKLIQKEFSAPTVFNSRSGTIDFEQLLEITKHAELIHESEQKDSAGVRAIELSDRTVGFIGLVDSNPRDPIMAGALDDSRYFAEMLSSLTNSNGTARYDLVSIDGSEALTVDKSPVGLLRSTMQAHYQEGVRDFYLNFSGHGNEHGIYFSSGWRSFRLSPDEIHSLFTEFDDCSFVVDTIACYGGGLAEAMKEYEDPSGQEGRIFMKLQAKPFSYNQEGRLAGEVGVNGAPAVHSSYYQIYNAYFLMQGLGFGEAHFQADLAAKQLIPCDAEGWISGKDGGRATLNE